MKPDLRHLANPIPVDKLFSPQFYAELWGISSDTVVRWFQDKPGVLKLSTPGRARRSRVELRIPFSIAMQEYAGEVEVKKCWLFGDGTSRPVCIGKKAVPGINARARSGWTEKSAAAAFARPRRLETGLAPAGSRPRSRTRRLQGIPEEA